MVSWQIWLIVAGVCFILEIITVGFLIFWFAIAALVVSLLSLLIPNVIVQSVIFVILSAILVLFTRPFAKKVNASDNTITNSNRFIGKTGLVKKALSEHQSGQVKVEGEVWTAVLDENILQEIPEGSTVEIIAIDGVKLIVKPKKIASKV